MSLNFILEELARILFSFISLFSMEASHLVRQNSNSTETGLVAGDGSGENTDLVRPRTEQTTTSLSFRDYGSTDISHYEDQPSLRRSLLQSVWTSITLNGAVIPLSFLTILLLYIDVNTSNLCFEQMKRDGKLPFEIMKWQLMGNVVEAVILNFWFQLTLILLFGWEKFKSRHSSTMLLGLLLGSTVAIFKTIVFILKQDFNKSRYRYPGNFLFLVGVIYTSYLVSAKICQINRTLVLGKGQIFTIISTQFFVGFIIAMVFRYAIVPWFNKVRNEIGKITIAMITPIIVLLPVAICEQLALKSSPFVHPGRSFVLIYFLNGVSIMLYRIMQAGFNKIWIFTGLSLFRASLLIIQKMTERLWHKIFTRFWQCLARVCHCARLGQQTHDTDHHRRLKLDKQIQVILYENTALVLSQAYLAVYQLTSFDGHAWIVLKHAIVKISIGLGINFFTNFLLVLISIHRYNSNVQQVWFKHWKLHMLATALAGAMTIWYFTAVLLTVYEIPANHPQGAKIKNCTGAF